MQWHPPETAPKDGTAFLVTTAGPNVDIVAWVTNPNAAVGELSGWFEDYYFKQRIAQEWPYMIGWAPLPEPAAIQNSEAETRAANGWPQAPL